MKSIVFIKDICFDYEMEIKQLKHFLAAAETESFSRGAERAFVSQPALSASIARLEAELETLLFVRNSKGVKLTSEGKRLARSAQKIIQECSRAKHEIREKGTGQTVRLGVSSSLAAARVARFTSQFQLSNAGVSMEVLDGRSDDIVDRFERGQLDVVIASQSGSANLRESEIELFREPYVVLVPDGHHLSGHESIDIAMLHNEPFIARVHCDYRDTVVSAFRAASIAPKMVYRTHSDDRAAAFASSGLGLAIVPEHFQAERTKKTPLRGDHMAYWRMRLREDAPDVVETFATYARAANWMICISSDLI